MTTPTLTPTEADRQTSFEGDESGRCGGCGSRRLFMERDSKTALCLDCHRIQEPETRDWPESQMCDNCAFRVGSPERADPYRWAEIEDTLARGQYFHCHKGLAATLSNEKQTVAFSPPDAKTGRVTVCAGWLASYIARTKRRAAKGLS